MGWLLFDVCACDWDCVCESLGTIGGGGRGGDSDCNGWLAGMLGSGACRVIGGGGGDMLPLGPFEPFDDTGFGDVSDAFD